MATKKKATKTTVTDVAVREQGGTAKSLIPYTRGEIARCSIQPYKADNLTPDANAPAVPGMADSWEDVTPDFPSTAYFEKVGDFLTGTYVGTKTVQANGKDTILYLLEVGNAAEAERIAVWDCTSLSLKMAKVKVGRRVCIQLAGMRPSKNFSNPWYDFRVLTPRT
jgi:hypothetical protein